jgi:succinoglycan biosynthesis protein ExoM
MSARHGETRSGEAVRSGAATVTVCIPTFRRPGMLLRCLDALARQTRDGFGVDVVVVDNDAAHSARPAVADWAKRNAVVVHYVSEVRQNIALARNAAVAAATGQFVAFIDDDEFADPDWLRRMLACCERNGAAGVLGPVLPWFEGTPPDWLVASGLCLRRSFATDTPLTDVRYMRTGNVLLRRSVFEGLAEPFDPRFGRTGGEDADFFGRMLAAGHWFVWCDEAPVHEEVPAARQTLRYHLDRALVRGVSEARIAPAVSVGTLKSILALAGYGVCLPLLRVVSYPAYVRYLVKCGDHAGKLLAYCGIRVLPERNF